jgi:UDP-N-acetylmuramoyl-L-alanyl-D-glutamate--2,6-diaminopimelate ligase
MGKIVWQLSDIVILTEDDSQSESVYKIIADVHAGVWRKEWDNYYIQPSRELALQLAVSIIKPGDILICAGKWHERALLTNYGKIEWNDLKKLKELLKINE